MSDIAWQDIVVSPCETYHLLKGEPLYGKRYIHVMKYHEPGLAPVKSGTHAFHIDAQGIPAYSNYFIETFGFYGGLAAVKNEDGWFHITPGGEPLYSARYAWCGNFQEGFCPVKDKKTNLYFHINRKGQKVYQVQYHYVGDFKDGYGVVCNEWGLHTHIDYHGNFIHEKWFLDLDVFHKGFAKAKDKKGWFHINKLGEPLYQERYAAIEPFYNRVARVEAFNGMLITLDEEGNKIGELREAQQKPWQQLSGDMIGFWRTETIATAIGLKLFDFLPNRTQDISLKLKLSSDNLERLLRALWELNLIYPKKDIWQLTEKGELLAPQGQRFLADAAIMWSDVNTENWKELSEFIRIGSQPRRSVFKATASDEKLQIYHRAIDGYAIEDFPSNFPIDWQSHQKIIGVGRTAKNWLEKILQKHLNLQATLLGEEYVLKYADIETTIDKRYCLLAHHVLEPWSETADAILLPKILHYYSDEDVLKILTHARRASLNSGKIYISEMLLEKNNPNGSLLDLNMLAESGGQLRFLSDWKELFAKSQLKLRQNLNITPWLNLLVLEA